MKKRIVAVIMVIAMVITLVFFAPLVVSADDGTDTINGSKVKSVVLGRLRSAEIMENGDLYCWTCEELTPVKVLSNVKSVSLGNDQIAAITENGDLYCWGYNLVTAIDQLTPVRVLNNVKYVSLEGDYSAAITENGDLYCWGYNEYGQVGNGTTDYQSTPVKVLSNVESVSLWNEHSAAITESGDLYCWGYNEYGQIGNGTNDYQLTPVKVLSDVESVSLGNEHSAAITESGDLYCWGWNYYGQVGNGPTDYQLTPVKVLSNVKSVSLWNKSSVAITENGDLYCWGWNCYGQVGNGRTNNQRTPVMVLNNVKSVSLGNRHVAAITENGDLYCWGWNYYGQVGNGTKETLSTPVKVLSNVESVSLEDDNSVAITEDGDLYCWGWNGYGQVGNGTKDTQSTPVKVLSNVESISLGYYHSAAITENGDLYCWGYNYYGQVGNGTTDNQLTPVKINITEDNSDVSDSESGEGDNKDDDVPVTDGCLTLTNSNITIISGQDKTLSGTVNGDDFDTLLDLYKNLDIQSSDESVVTVSRSVLDSILPSKATTRLSFNVDAHGYIGESDVTISCKDGHKVVCHVTVVPEELESDVTFATGKINSVDGLSGKVVIDDKTYDATDDLDLTKVQTLYNDNGDKTVIARLENGYISSLDAVEDVVKPVVSVTSDKKDVTYQNGQYDTQSIGIKLSLGCVLNSPYSGYKKKIDAVSMKISNIDIKAVGDGLKIGGGSEKNDSVNISLHPGETSELSYSVDIDKSYVVSDTKKESNISANISTDYGNASGSSIIYFGNLDKQKSVVTTTKSTQKQAQQQLVNGNGVTFALDSSLSTYFNKAEIEEIEHSLSVWFSSTLALEKIIQDGDSEFMKDVKKRCGLTTDDIMNKVFDKLGIKKSMKSLTIASQYTATTSVYVKDKWGNKTCINFVLYFSDFAFYEQKAYGSFGKLSYTFTDSDGQEHHPLGGVGGVVTYSDLDGFISSVQGILEVDLKSWYSKFWGDNANKTIEMLSSNLVNKILNTNGSFSDHVFDLLKAPTTKWWKVTNSCPNDVYIYDSEGNLYASIVNNEVVSGEDNVFIYADGDVKYFYLMGDDYLIKYVGNDTGTMNVKLEAYEDGELVRTISYENMALEKGKTYEAVVTDSLCLDADVYNPETEDVATTSANDTKTTQSSNIVSVESIAFSYSNVNMAPKDTYQLQAIFTPLDATFKDVVYTSADTKVATVDENGKVTAVSDGSTVITATALDGNCATTVAINVKTAKTPKTKNTIKSQTIKVSQTNYTKEYGAKAFKLNAKTTGNGKLTYKSSNSKIVKVNSTGRVTIKGIGKATITVKASATSKYKSTAKKISITIKPGQTVVKKVSATKKRQLKLSWKKDSKVSGYEIIVATDKKFTKNKKVYKIKIYKTTTKTISKLKSGKTYYVKIRGYKIVKGKKLYGKYSKIKKVKVK